MGKQYKCGGCSGGWENNTNMALVVVYGETNVVVVVVDGKTDKCGGCSGGWENNTNVVVVVVNGKTIQIWWL